MPLVLLQGNCHMLSSIRTCLPAQDLANTAISELVSVFAAAHTDAQVWFSSSSHGTAGYLQHLL